jgi:serine/threonine-protein kinase
VEVLDFGKVDGRLFMALEFVDGYTCADLIDRLLNRRRTVDLQVVLYMLREVLRGLSYLHTACDGRGRSLGLVHRDIAPNNVLVSKVGQVKIADFGIYYSCLAERHTAPGELKGKLGYVSPEQARGERVDGRSDLFSLSVMTAEMLIGVALFQGENPFEIYENLSTGDLSMLYAYGRHLPDDVKSVLARGLAADREQRYPNADTMAIDIQWLIQRHGLEMESYEFAQWMADMGLLALKSGVSVVPPARQPG